MDILRGRDGNLDSLDELESNYLTDDADDAGLERPPAIGTDERRMQVRAYNYWARLLGDHDYPLIDTLDPGETLDFGEYCVLLDFTDGIDNPKIAYLGNAIAEECEMTVRVERLDDVPSRSLLSRITDHYMQIHANKAPIGFEAEFVNQKDRTILYRGILLPFSSTGEEIDYIYGVINWKEAVDGEQAEELQLEVSQALDSVERELPAMSAWADGPVDPARRDRFDSPIADPFSHDADTDDGDLPQPLIDDGIYDWLHSARAAAEAAETADRRSRKALYKAVGRAYDFALIAERDADAYAEMLTDAGLPMQSRAPYTPLVKLIFGVGYDKTRIAEIATLIAYAREKDIALGDCGQWIEHYKGGLKAIVAEARADRNGRKARKAPATADRAYLERLRKLPARPISDFAGEGSEFVLLVARRSADGTVELIGSVEEEQQMIESAMKKIAL